MFVFSNFRSQIVHKTSGSDRPDHSFAPAFGLLRRIVFKIQKIGNTLSDFENPVLAHQSHTRIERLACRRHWERFAPRFGA